jgi:TDP-4-oxo-6-deoxy-alpha-D-glucose-3,4-oxoisomerase
VNRHSSNADASPPGPAGDTSPIAGFSSQIADIRLVDLPTIESDVAGATGAITVFEASPFAIKRIYWIHGAGDGELRGHHAHRTLWQMLVAIVGAFEIKVTTDCDEKTFVLDTPRRGLLLGPGFWRSIAVRRAGSVLMVAASAPFSEADYIRDHDAFLAFRKTMREKP